MHTLPEQSNGYQDSTASIKKRFDHVGFKNIGFTYKASSLTQSAALRAVKCKNMTKQMTLLQTIIFYKITAFF